MNGLTDINSIILCRLLYVVNGFIDGAGKSRYIVTNLVTEMPTIGLSIYEFDRMVSGHSPNSTCKELKQLIYLYSWSLLNGVDMDSLLLRGGGMSEVHVRKFTHWLRERKVRGGKRLTVKQYNLIVNKCSSFCSWMRTWQEKTDVGSNAVITRMQLDEVEKQSWRNRMLRDRTSKISPDLDENEILAIQNLLKPDLDRVRGYELQLAFRNYLIWRLAIEMGLRISEILALRLQDCPQRGRNYISVVRIEERGHYYVDPRGVNAPRPKTLSRDLGFIINNTPLPKLIQDYISKYRYKKMLGGTKQFVLDHEFLIIAHDTAAPLSVFSAESISSKIAKNSGVGNFHWHLARHAFFNRAYAAVADNESHINDLIYYGGWSNQSSINTYIQRAIRNRSIKTLAVWQSNRWEAIE